MMYAPLADLSGKHGTEPIPPQPYCLVANVDAAFEQYVFDLTQRQWIADVQHQREANDLGRTVEITEGFLHPKRLRTTRSRIKRIFSDKAILTTESVCAFAGR